MRSLSGNLAEKSCGETSRPDVVRPPSRTRRGIFIPAAVEAPMLLRLHVSGARERERRHVPCVLVENKRPRQRRLGALAAIFPLAQPAVDADRRALGTVDVVARRIDELGGMANLAAAPDGETRLHMRPRHGGAAQRLCDREIA